MTPLVSVVVTAYNRANTITRTVQSILNQTYNNIEIIIVDDGSTDNTNELIEKIEDKRIRIFRHPKNGGVIAAKNTALDNIKGEWFVFVDSDDEIIPEAIETLIKIPLEFDKEVTAIDSGAFETVSNKLSEQSFKSDQYVDEGTIIRECRGDVWGMTKTSLIGSDRLNENLPGWEDILWYKVNARAKRYYIHKQLYIYHTEGADRISKKHHDLNSKSKTYKALLNEGFFLDRIKTYNKKRFIKYCLIGAICLSATGDKKNSRIWLNKIKEVNSIYYIIILLLTFLPRSILKYLSNK